MLKEEYLQEKSKLNGYLQLGAELSTEQKSENEAMIMELKHRLEKKKEHVRKVSEGFVNMHKALATIKSSFAQEKEGSEQTLEELNSQDDDTKLSMLF